jgi:hypothetical protein
MEGERNELQAQLVASQEQLSNALGEKQRVLQALLAISRTRAYRLLRRLGRWEWVEQILAQASPDSPG